MPWGLTRFQHSGQSHFVTFCCYHRGRLLTTDESRRIFESALERVRRRFRLQVYGHVVMPEHVHLLLSEPQASGGRTIPLKPTDGLNGPPVLLCEPQQDAFGCGTAPLKPTDGLNGPPVLLCEPQEGPFSCGTVPLKPKDGLNGPPVLLREPQEDAFSCGTAPLKPKDGLNGPPVLLREPQEDAFSCGTAPLKPKDGLNGPPVCEPHAVTLADALKSLKQGVSRRLIGDAEHFWQKRYYDFNVRDYAQFVEKLRYIHRNPVRAGFCERPEDWAWSSFRHYATGCEGRVEIESEWTARKRERAAGRICAAVEVAHNRREVY